MRVGIASDHGGFVLKDQVAELLRSSGHEVVDFGAHELNPGDDFPDFVIPLARAVAAGQVERGWRSAEAEWAHPLQRTKLRACGPDSSTMCSPPTRALKTTT